MMKKITLLFILLTVSYGFSQSLPFDFESSQPFTPDGGVVVSNPDDGSGSNKVLQIEGAVADWDNAQVTFAAPIDLSDNANNTLRFTFKSTSAAPGEIHQHGVSFQDGGGAIEANFQSVGTDLMNVELNFGAGLGSRARMVIFTDVGNFGAQSATGGQSGNPTPGLQGTYQIDDITLGADPGPTCSDGMKNGDETGVDCGGSTCPACPPPGSNLIGNGGFETGDFTDWQVAPGTGQTIITANPSEGTYAANINNTVTGTASGIKSANRGIGSVNPGDEVTVKFDARGSFDIGGVLFAELFSEFSGGGASNQLLGGGPLTLDPDPNVWTSFEFTTNLGGDVGGGISLLFNALTGGGSSANVFIDNVSVVNNDQLSNNDFLKNTFKVFPNPTQNNWIIKTEDTSIESIRVFDLMGKNVLYVSPNKSETTLDGSGLISGLYFAQIKTALGTKSIKLIKQ